MNYSDRDASSNIREMMTTGWMGKWFWEEQARPSLMQVREELKTPLCNPPLAIPPFHARIKKNTFGGIFMNQIVIYLQELIKPFLHRPVYT